MIINDIVLEYDDVVTTYAMSPVSCDLFAEGLMKAGISTYGWLETFEVDKVPAFYPDSASEFGDFIICPYIYDDEPRWWRLLPNFYDKATGTAIWWYKAASREVRSNRQLKAAGVYEMMCRLQRQAAELGATPYE